jgi:hypothetical protein
MGLVISKGKILEFFVKMLSKNSISGLLCSEELLFYLHVLDMYCRNENDLANTTCMEYKSK